MAAAGGRDRGEGDPDAAISHDVQVQREAGRIQSSHELVDRRLVEVQFSGEVDRDVEGGLEGGDGGLHAETSMSGGCRQLRTPTPRRAPAA
ncbi:MAG: hypothetical protein QM622_01950 [Microbacterium sp.]